MSRCLTVAFLVASFGGALSLYSAISVGSSGLINMGAQLQSLAVVVNNYYTVLNANRPLVNATLDDLGYYINKTYATMNKTYGTTQPNTESLMTMVSNFNQSLWMGEMIVSNQFGIDLNQMSYSLQQTIDVIFQYFQMLTPSITAHDQSFIQDKCVAKNMTQMIAVPSSLSKLGPCLQQEVNTANAITPTIVASIKLLKNDLVAFNNLLNICQPTSTTCIQAFFSSAVSDLSSVQNALQMVLQYVYYIQYDANRRNLLCGDLVKAEVKDTTQDLLMTVVRCTM